MQVIFLIRTTAPPPKVESRLDYIVAGVCAGGSRCAPIRLKLRDLLPILSDGLATGDW